MSGPHRGTKTVQAPTPPNNAPRQRTTHNGDTSELHQLRNMLHQRNEEVRIMAQRLTEKEQQIDQLKRENGLLRDYVDQQRQGLTLSLSHSSPTYLTPNMWAFGAAPAVFNADPSAPRTRPLDASDKNSGMSLSFGSSWNPELHLGFSGSSMQYSHSQSPSPSTMARPPSLGADESLLPSTHIPMLNASIAPTATSRQRPSDHILPFDSWDTGLGQFGTAAKPNSNSLVSSAPITSRVRAPVPTSASAQPPLLKSAPSTVLPHLPSHSSHSTHGAQSQALSPRSPRSPLSPHPSSSSSSSQQGATSIHPQAQNNVHTHPHAQPVLSPPMGPPTSPKRSIKSGTSTSGTSLLFALSSESEVSSDEEASLPTAPLSQSLPTMRPLSVDHVGGSQLSRSWNTKKAENPAPKSPQYDFDLLIEEKALLDVATTQTGCRFLQKKLEENNAVTTSQVFQGLIDHMEKLVTDQFGNYLFTRLVETCAEPQRDRIVQKILPHIIEASMDPYGTQSLQKILPFLNRHQTGDILSVIQPSVLLMIKHPKANYLIQYFLDKTEPVRIAWLYQQISRDIIEISCDRVGCVIVKKALTSGSGQELQNLIQTICENCEKLVSDPFGNYVLQHMLQRHPGPALPAIQQLQKHLLALSQDKCSSPVIEQCLRAAPRVSKQEMIAEIFSEQQKLETLANHRYANYVVQTALAEAHKLSPTLFQECVAKILPILNAGTGHGIKRIQKKLCALDKREPNFE